MSSIWFPHYRPRPGAMLRLLSFPFAGGGASLYRGWEPFLPPEIELCAVQLPGREGRYREPLCRNIDRMLDEVQYELAGLPEMRCALAGYSVGAIFAYALALRLTSAGAAPAHLVVAACPSPGFVNERALKSSMPDRDFEARVLELNDDTPELLTNRDLLSIMIPSVRADIEIVESFDAGPRTRVSYPISAFGGEADPAVARAHLEDWRSMTTSDFSLRWFPGKHFFMRDCLSDAVSWIAQRLADNSSGACGAAP